MTTTVSISYAAAQTITITTNNKNNGVWQQSTYVDNATNLYIDALVSGSIQAGTTPTVNNTFEIYAYGYDGTNYTAGCSGSDGTYTADGEEDELRMLAVVTVDTSTDQDYVWGPVSAAAAFGGVLPQRWGIVIRNNTGVTTNTTGTNNICKYVGIKYVSA